MKIIAISGSVGAGKTILANKLGKKLNYKVISLNDWGKEFKLKDVEKLQTFDFDIDELLIKVENYINENKNINGLIFEGHFAHLINPKLVDFLFIINRDLKELEKVYKERGYNLQKIKDNLEVESFNLCFYEGIEEGYEEEKQIFCFDNNDYNAINNIEKKLK